MKFSHWIGNQNELKSFDSTYGLWMMDNKNRLEFCKSKLPTKWSFCWKLPTRDIEMNYQKEPFWRNEWIIHAISKNAFKFLVWHRKCHGNGFLLEILDETGLILYECSTFRYYCFFSRTNTKFVMAKERAISTKDLLLIVCVYLMRWISWLWWLWWRAWCMNGTLMRWCWMIWMSISWRWPWMIWPMIWSTCTRRCWITLRVWNLSWWILKFCFMWICDICEFVLFCF